MSRKNIRVYKKNIPINRFFVLLILHKKRNVPSNGIDCDSPPVKILCFDAEKFKLLTYRTDAKGDPCRIGRR